jgi:hypothetical protein
LVHATSGTRDAIVSAVARLSPIALDDVGNAALLNRFESKFLVPAPAMADVLQCCAASYRVLDVGGRRLCGYSTTYFDTADLAFYRAHQTGRLPRRKVRLRTYVDTGARFLEIKDKGNSGRTRKTRVALDGDTSCDGALAALLAERSPGRRLLASMRVDYKRVTLVSMSQDERVTFDCELAVMFGNEIVAYPGVAIIEVKRGNRGRSGFLDAMRTRRFRTARFSKYCLGVSALRADAICYRDPRILRQLQRVSHGIADAC